MSEQGTCKECRKFKAISPGTISHNAQGACCREPNYTQYTWADCYGCPSFERKRDKWEDAAHEVERAHLEARADVLRRNFPEPDRAAVHKVLRTFVTSWTNTGVDELTDAVLAAIEGEVKPCE